MKKKHFIGILVLIIASSLLYSCSSDSKDIETPPEGWVTDYEGIADRNLAFKNFKLTNYEEIVNGDTVPAMDQVEDYFKDDEINFNSKMDPYSPTNHGRALLFLNDNKGPDASDNFPYLEGYWNVNNGSKNLDGSVWTKPEIIFPFFTNIANDNNQVNKYLNGTLLDIDTSGAHVVFYMVSFPNKENKTYKCTFTSVDN